MLNESGCSGKARAALVDAARSKLYVCDESDGWRSKTPQTAVPPGQGEMSAPSLQDYRFAVVDVETTGLFPRANDRIVEIAVIGVDCQGEICDEFVTLVNPERDVGPTRIHGISAGDVLAAPLFSEIAGDLAKRLARSVIVAHNARFDHGFLEAEFNRMGLFLPAIPMLCTLKLARRVPCSAASLRLTDLCSSFGIQIEQAHSALMDARAVGCLFGVLLDKVGSESWRTLVDWRPSTSQPPARAWPSLLPSRRSFTREHAAQKIPPSYLAELAQRLPPVGGLSAPNVLEYVDLLDRVLEDRRVTSEESESLLDVAMRWGLTGEEVTRVHNEFLNALVETALGDGVVTDVERKELRDVAQLLGHDAEYVDSLIASFKYDAIAPKGLAVRGGVQLRGMSVCLTGESCLMFKGEPLSRPMAERLAADAGMIVKSSVAKKLDLLIAVDPDSLSGKARKAREYGTRVMAETVFWRLVGVEMQLETLFLL